MPYDLNAFFQFDNNHQGNSRLLVYPNQFVAARLINHAKERGAREIPVVECIATDASRLPMPHELMAEIDKLAGDPVGYYVVVGLDAYLALLNARNVEVFMIELRERLDKDAVRIDYILSCDHSFPFSSRYEEARKVVFLDGDIETWEPIQIWAYHAKWAANSANVGFRVLLREIGIYYPVGTHNAFLPDISSGRSGLGKAVTFVTDIHDISANLFQVDMDIDASVLEHLLEDSIRCSQTVDAFLSDRVREEYCNPRQAMARLLALQDDRLWPAYVWYVKRKMPEQSYMTKVLSEEVTSEALLRKYAVEAAISVLSDANAQKYAAERAEGLQYVGKSTQIESLVIEFITSTRDRKNAISFLNCGTFSEKAEMIRRAAAEDLSVGLPRQYGELYPALADYLSFYDWGSATINAYFEEYRRLKLLDSLTDDFALRAYNTVIPGEIPARDSVLVPLRMSEDTALLVVDALGIEYLPVLTAMAKRRGLYMEPPKITTANIPTETEFNPIQWETERTLVPVKGLDNIVHDGVMKHETALPECCFAETLQIIETDVLNRVVDGLSRFSRVVVTADHGSSRLCVIARRDGIGRTLPWSRKPGEEPLDWRYSTALEGVQRPKECESQYFPDSGKTYWVVRGYHRLPKKGGKKYALHGGASLEERLVPIMIFTRNADTDAAVTTQAQDRQFVELKDEFEGII